MSDGTHEHHMDDAGAYLLDALSPDETRDFKRHMRDCTECRRELAILRVAADALPRSVEQLAPPPELKRALMRRVREEERAAEAERPRVPLLRRLGADRMLGGFRPALAGVGAALLLLAGVAGGLVIANGGGDPDARVVTASVDRTQLPDASASLRVVDEADGGVLRVTGLPLPRPRRTYEVWLRRGESVEPGGVFTVTRDGSGTVAIPGSLEGVDEVMITSEEEGGVRAPTSAPVIRIAV